MRRVPPHRLDQRLNQTILNLPNPAPNGVKNGSIFGRRQGFLLVNFYTVQKHTGQQTTRPSLHK